MSIFNKIAAKIVDSQENSNKIPLDEMNFRQRATHYTGQMLGAGVGKMMPDSMMQLLGDAIRNEKAAREEQRAQNQKQDQEAKSKEERDKKLDNRIAGTNQRLDELVKINKKLLKIIEDGGGSGSGFGSAGGVAAAGAVGIMGMLKNLVMSRGVTGMAVRGGIAYGADAASGLFGLGSNKIDTKRDNENWNKMSLLDKVESSVARSVEHVGDWIMPNITNEARASRIDSESDYINKQDQSKIKQLLKQRLSPDQRKQYEDDIAAAKGLDPQKMTPESSKALIRAMKAKRELAQDDRYATQLSAMGHVDANNRPFAFMGAPPTSAPTPLPIGTGRVDLNNLPVPHSSVASVGSNKSVLIQAIEQQTALRQQSAANRAQEIRLDGDNIYIGSKNSGQVIKFESPLITYEADRIEFKLRNGEAVPGTSALPNSTANRSTPMPGAPGNDTPAAMLDALKQMGYNPGGSASTGPGRGQSGQPDNGSQQPTGPADPNGHPVLQQQRQKFFDELEKDPQLKSTVMGLVMKENGAHPEGPLEAMMNRAEMNGKSLRDTVYSGFYGPINRGEVRGAPQGRDLEKAQRAFDRVRGGSNDIELRTDQGMINEHHGQAGMMEKHGEWYSYQGKKGEKYAASTQKQIEEYDRAHPDWRQQRDSGQPNSGSNSNFNWGKVDKSKINPDLASAAEAAAGYLPNGYSVRATSGHRPGDPRLHGRHMAADFEIVGPNGEAIPNAGKDSTGMYRQYAQHMYGWMQQNNPEAAGKLAWGGSFPIPYGRRFGQADLMHFDLGGQRGRWAQFQPQNMGGVRGVDYARAAPKPEQDSNERIRAAAMLSRQQSTPATPPPSPPKQSDPMSEELGKIGYVGTQPSGGISNSPSSGTGNVGIARDYFERLFGDSPSGWS